MWPSRTLSVSIQCDAHTVYEFVANPKNLPRWAKTFCRSVTRSKGAWIIDTPRGAMTIRLAKKNASGILDHYLSPSPGVEVFVPMRVVPNSQGSEVIFTLFQPPEMSDGQYANDIGLVQQDLSSLKQVMERSRGSRS